jgi:tetratricopeptide (TPR) repeat protein
LSSRTAFAVALIAALALCLGCGRGSATGDVESLLARGWKAYATGDFDFAVRQFEAARKGAGLTVEQEYSAVLGLATVYHYQPNPALDRAQEFYLILSGLDHPGAETQSLLGLARVDMARGERLEAQSRLNQLVERYPDSQPADEAVLQLADLLTRPTFDEARPGDFDLPAPPLVERTVLILTERLEKRPHNHLASAMHMMLANIFVQTGEFTQAVEHLIAADEEGIAVVKTRGTVLWRIARIAEKDLQDYELAARYYEMYVEEFQRTALYYRALMSLKRVRELAGETEADSA